MYRREVPRHFWFRRREGERSELVVYTPVLITIYQKKRNKYIELNNSASSSYNMRSVLADLERKWSR
jgi:hypothetical protein